MKGASENIILPNTKFCCGPISSNLCKHAALTCFENGEVDKGIHHLTESHAIGFRSKLLSPTGQLHEMQAKYLKLPNISFDLDLINFDSQYAVTKEKGLMKRLQELPEEWTLVQLTQGFSNKTRSTPREAGTASNDTVLHITRLTCGRNTRKPCCVTLPKESVTAEKLTALFDVIDQSSNPVAKNATPSKLLREMLVPINKVFPKINTVSKSSRQEFSQTLKLLVDEITTDWLQQWKCLFLGQLQSSDLKSKIKKTVDNVLAQCKVKLEENKISILYQIADGSAHLDYEEIKAAVADCIPNPAACKAMTAAIVEFKESNLSLAIAKRYPVLLILDEILDRVPWEMISILRRHPVSRIFSVHFAHAMFRRFKQKFPFENGCFVMEECNDGYYLVNPDKDLRKMQKKVCDFLSSRIPSWDGVAGRPPTNEEFSKALASHSLMLYCGHGNGTQYFASDDIFSLSVKAIPLLFGCSSIKMNDFGGRVNLSGVAMKYLTAGSPCVLGMLWKVTSNDADNMSITLLNNSLPGKSIDVSKFVAGKVEISIKSEPELLRSLKLSRESCVYYTNAASLVVYGIPIKFS